MLDRITRKVLLLIFRMAWLSLVAILFCVGHYDASIVLLIAIFAGLDALVSKAKIR